MNDTGRAGRMRVERRLRTARHGAELLDRKRQIMADELERLQLHAGGLRDEWETCARDASVWLQRATALDGQVGVLPGGPRRSIEQPRGEMGAVGRKQHDAALSVRQQRPAPPSVKSDRACLETTDCVVGQLAGLFFVGDSRIAAEIERTGNEDQEADARQRAGKDQQLPGHSRRAARASIAARTGETS